MKRSKDTFLELQQFEAMQYSPDFTRKKAQEHGKKAANEVLDSGNTTPIKALTNAVRLKEFINSFESELRSKIEITEETTENGVKFTIMNTGDRLDYEQDEKYKELSDKLKERGELLKLAYKSKDTIYDSEGEEVPKVGIKTHGKETIKLSF